MSIRNGKFDKKKSLAQLCIPAIDLQDYLFLDDRKLLTVMQQNFFLPLKISPLLLTEKFQHLKMCSSALK